jgi:hypothetical protein
LYKNTVNWNTLEKQIYDNAKNAKTVLELKPAFTTLLNGLRDHHGRIIDLSNYSLIAYCTEKKNRRNPDKREWDLEVGKVVNDSTLKFDYKFLKENIGYLKIVGIGPRADMEKEAKNIRNAINNLSKTGVEKWIVALRYNTGGNMNRQKNG